jgi:hypothetical protein
VNFQDGCSSAQALRAVPSVFRELLLQPAGFEDLIDTFHDPTLARAILSLSVQRIPSKGPMFDSPSGGFLVDPCVDTIERKFQKAYHSHRPIELLAYIDLNPMFPEEVWKPKLYDLLKGRGIIAPFRKIWVLDLTTGNIELTWPES